MKSLFCLLIFLNPVAAQELSPQERDEYRQEIKQLKPGSAKAAEAIALLKSWLKDDSGYDEQTWPKLKKALDQQRAKVGARRLFDE